MISLETYEDFKNTIADEIVDLIEKGFDRYDAIVEVAASYADVYNLDLLDWLKEDLTRAKYIDKVIEEYGCKGSTTIFDLITAGQIEYIIEKSEEYLDKYMEELKEYA